MIESIAKRFALCLHDESDFDSDLYEVHTYGIMIVISSAINIMITALQALCFGRPLDAIIYLACTRPLRKYGGGWHSRMQIVCVALHAFSFAFVSWASFWLQHLVSAWILLLNYALVLAIIITKAPSEHPNNPINPSYRQKRRMNCVIIVISSLVSSLVALALGFSQVAALILLSSLSVAITLLIPNKL